MNKFKSLGRMLGKGEQRKIKGGVSTEGSGIMYCCVHTADWSQNECSNVNPSDAQSYAASLGAGWKWCCTSCASSWTAATGLPWVTP